jgi:hypothetical protein
MNVDRHRAPRRHRPVRQLHPGDGLRGVRPNPRQSGAHLDDAIDIEWELVGYVITRDIDRAFTVSEKLEVGMVGLNAGTAFSPGGRDLSQHRRSGGGCLPLRGDRKHRGRGKKNADDRDRR